MDFSEDLSQILGDLLVTKCSDLENISIEMLMDLRDDNTHSARLHNWNAIGQFLDQLILPGQPSILTQDTKSLLLANDRETMEKVQKQILEVMKANGVEGVLASHDSSINKIQSAPQQVQDKITVKGRDSANVLYDTPAKYELEVVQETSDEQIKMTRVVRDERNRESFEYPKDAPPILTATQIAKDTPQFTHTKGNSDSKLAQTDTTLMFILTSITEALQLPNMKQAAAFLTSDSKYLLHACHKGMKGGNFEPIFNWLFLIEENILHLLDLIDEDPDSLQNVLQVVSCGLASKDQQCVEKSAKIVSKILGTGRKLGSLSDEDRQSILFKALTSVQMHESLNQKIGALLIQVAYFEQYDKLVKDMKKQHSCMPQFLEVLSFSGLENDKNSMVEFVIDSIEKFDDDVILNLRIIIQIWSLSHQVMDEKIDGGITVLDMALKVLVKACRDSNRAIRLSAQGIIFEHLTELANSKNPKSPGLYKLLTFSFIENFNDDITREFLSNSFITLFEKHRSIPVSILLEPLIRKSKQVYLGESQTERSNARDNVSEMSIHGEQYGVIMPFDIKLIKAIINHPKLRLDAPQGQGGTAIELADFLAELIMTNRTHQLQISGLQLQLMGRFQDNPQMLDFIKKFFIICLGKYMDMASDMSKQFPLDVVSQARKHSSFFNSEQNFWDPEQATKRIQFNCTLHMVDKILELISSNQNLKQDMIEILFKQKMKFQKKFSIESKGLRKVLDLHVSNDQFKSLMMTEEDDSQSPALRYNSLNDRAELTEQKELENDLMKLNNSAILHNLHNDNLDSMSNASVPIKVSDSMTKENRFKNSRSTVQTDKPPIPGSSKQKVKKKHVQIGDDDHISIPDFDQMQILPAGSPQSMGRELKQRLSERGSRQGSPSTGSQMHIKVVDNSQIASARVRQMRSRSKADQRAQEQLEKIKAKKDEEALKKKIEEEEAQKKAERQKRNLSKQLKKRRLQLGLSTPKGKQVELVQLSKDSEQKDTQDTSGQVQVSRNHSTNRSYQVSNPDSFFKTEGHEPTKKFVMLDISQEEQRDQDELQILIQKYQKLFKFLFGKYAMTRTQTSKNVQGFDFYSDKSMNFSELSKLLRDYGISQKTLSKSELTNFLKSYSQYFLKRNDLGELTFTHFIQFLTQLGITLYKNDPPQFDIDNLFGQDDTFVTPAKSLQKLIQTFELAAASKSMALTLFQDPKGIGAVSESQRQKIGEIQERLKTQPGSLIPEGYQVVKETEQVEEYKAPRCLGESKCVALDIIDDLVFKTCGAHFLMPMVTTKVILKVRPKLALGKVTSSREREPSIEEIHAKRSRSVRKLSPINKSVDLQNVEIKNLRKELTSGIDTIDEKAPYKPKPQMLPPRPGKILNPAMQAKRDQEEKELREKQLRDEKLKRRQEQVKKAMSEERSKKEQKDEDQKAKEALQAAQEAERKKQEKLARQKQAEKKKELEKLKQKKKDDEEEKERLREAEEQKIKRQKSLAAKAFVEKQKEKLQKEFEAKTEQRDKQFVAKAEDEKAKQERVKAQKAKMEKMISQQGKNLKELEAKERQGLKAFRARNDIQQVIQGHEKTLFQFFKVFATQDRKQEIGKEQVDDAHLGLNCNEFLKFGRQYGVSSSKEMNQEDMQVLFRTTLRDRKEDPDAAQAETNMPTMISFQEFIGAMIRAHLLWTQPPIESGLSQDKNVVDHPSRILKALEVSTAVTFEAFLFRLEGKNLRGYSRKISPQAPQLQSQRGSMKNLQSSPKNSLFGSEDKSPVKINKNIEFQQKFEDKDLQKFLEHENEVAGTVKQSSSTKIDQDSSKKETYSHKHRKLKSVNLPPDQQSTLQTPALKQDTKLDQNIEDSMMDSAANVGTVKRNINQKINVDEEDSKAIQQMLDDIPDFDIEK